MKIETAHRITIPHPPPTVGHYDIFPKTKYKTIMPLDYKPKFIHRFFIKLLFGIIWVDQK